MNKDDFLQRFSFAQTIQPVQEFSFSGTTHPAAVLIALHETQYGLEVILTKRAAHLRHPAGQISFPGGKAEPDDDSLIHTALRETQEEIGLALSTDTVIGSLPQFTTISGFAVTPVIALTDTFTDFAIDHNEVDTVFSVPLHHILNRDNHLSHSVQRYGQDYPIYFIPWQNTYIWGATAGMLINLAKVLGLKD